MFLDYPFRKSLKHTGLTLVKDREIKLWYTSGQDTLGHDLGEDIIELPFLWPNKLALGKHMPFQKGINTSLHKYVLAVTQNTWKQSTCLTRETRPWNRILCSCPTGRHICVSMYMYVRMYVHVCMYVHMCMYAYVHLIIRVDIVYMCVCVYVCAHVWTYYKFTCMCYVVVKEHRK